MILPRGDISAFETTSLTNKFKSLWLAGVESKLVFETRAGQSWGSLHVCLGAHPGQAQPPPYPQEPLHKNDSPAKKRRRERRKAAREEAAADFNNEDVVDRETTYSNYDKDTNENVDISSATEEVTVVGKDTAEQSDTEKVAANNKLVDQLKERTEYIRIRN